MSFLPGAFPAGVIASKAPKALTFVGGVADNFDRTTYTFAGLGVSPDANDRLVICAIAWTGNVTVSSGTIAGISATIHAQALGVSTTFRGSAIMSAVVPAGSPVTAVFNLSGGATNGSIEAYKLLNANSFVPYHTNSVGTLTGAAAATTLNIPAGGVAIGAASMSTTAPTAITWSGLTLDQTEGPYETVNVSGGASGSGMTLETARAISATVVSGSTPRGSLCVASWD